MNKVCIVGASGRLGQYMVQHALDRGYDLTLVKDAHTTGTMDLGNGTRIEAASIIDELNIAMAWVTYPDRSSSTARAAQLEFAADGGAQKQ